MWGVGIASGTSGASITLRYLLSPRCELLRCYVPNPPLAASRRLIIDGVLHVVPSFVPACYSSLQIHGVVFVVDASDVSRLQEARKVLRRAVEHEYLGGKPVLILVRSAHAIAATRLCLPMHSKG